MNQTLVYIVWPLTLALAVGVGSMIGGSADNGDANARARAENGVVKNRSVGRSEVAVKIRGSQRRGSSGVHGAGNKDYAALTLHEQLHWLVRELESCGSGDFEELYLKVERAHISYNKAELWRGGGLRPRLSDGSNLGRKSQLSLVVAQWAKVDPVGTLNFLKEKGENSLVGTALESWAKFDDTSAIAWVKQNSEGRSREKLLVDVVKGVALVDTMRCAELINLLVFCFRWNRTIGGLKI